MHMYMYMYMYMCVYIYIYIYVGLLNMAILPRAHSKATNPTLYHAGPIANTHDSYKALQLNGENLDITWYNDASKF